MSPRPSPTSYGHAAVKVSADSDTIATELTKRGIAFRIEPRAMGFLIPVIDDLEGNMIELFSNLAHVELPAKALCPPQQIDAALAQIRLDFEALTKNLRPGDGFPVLLFESQSQQQQQQ